MGQTFLQYSSILPAGAIEQWTVVDLPEVTAQATAALKNGHSALSFTPNLKSSSGYNVFLATGSLHYWESTLAELAASIGTFPDHFIINRSPIRSHGAPFVAIQSPGEWAVPCLVRTQEQIEAELHGLGFELRDVWDVPEKTLLLPYFPGHTTNYRGLYFSRLDQST